MRSIFTLIFIFYPFFTNGQDPFPGVTLIRRVSSGPLRVFILKIDLKNPRISFETVMAHDQVYGPQEKTSDMAKRRHAQLAVNGDYFGRNHHNCEELFYTRGKRIYIPPHPFRCFINISIDNEVYINKERTGIHFYNTIGGGPHFIKNKKYVWDQTVSNKINGEGFTPNTVFDASTNPWTAVGTNSSGTILYLFVVDGRQTSWSVGVSPYEMAQLMIKEGVYEAMRFDGGGSSTMWIESQGVINRPSDGSERPVGTALLVFVDEAPYFVRGDVNSDGATDLSDVISLLLYLFSGKNIDCLDAGDINNSGSIDLSDAISFLSWLFDAGEPPSSPFPGCGGDTKQDSLTCISPPEFCL